MALRDLAVTIAGLVLAFSTAACEYGMASLDCAQQARSPSVGEEVLPSNAGELRIGFGSIYGLAASSVSLDKLVGASLIGVQQVDRSDVIVTLGIPPDIAPDGGPVPPALKVSFVFHGTLTDSSACPIQVPVLLVQGPDGVFMFE